ncbi:MAG TPA: GIY-YIG nuclease family protein, partial [Ohtaekwangia sp.]
MSFCVYVLHAVEHDKIYIGFTSDLDSRIPSHNVLLVVTFPEKSS